MEFNQKSVHPGEKVDLTLTAPPYSLCAMTTVDKSVYLMGGVNLLMERQINKRLEQYDVTSDFVSDWQYCSVLSILPPDFSNLGTLVCAFTRVTYIQ